MIAQKVLPFLILLYVVLIIPFSAYIKNRPMDVKLGHFPDAGILKATTGEFRTLSADLAIMRILFYYGTLVDPDKKNTVQDRPEYPNMYKTLETVIRLDPYNIDAYYFSQAAFTWEIGHAADVNRMLEYGMRYRTWDYWLPFYAGFNEAYFLKNYARAAIFMRKAAEISGDQLFTGLTGRYFYESGQTALGIAFLDTMIKGAKDQKLRKVYEIRRTALVAVEAITQAVRRCASDKGKSPVHLRQLITEGYLVTIPKDPYGGEFYLDGTGKVRSTSKFAFSSTAGEQEKDGR